jgi:hypothetical protein
MAFTDGRGGQVQATAPLDKEFLEVCRGFGIESDDL